MNDTASFPAIERVLSRHRQDQQNRANSESICASQVRALAHSCNHVYFGCLRPRATIKVNSLRAALNELDSFINATAAPAADQVPFQLFSRAAVKAFYDGNP
jgi:hypothetical protein